MSVDTDPIKRITLKLAKIANLEKQDVADLGQGCQRAIIEDNRRGVLSGFDKDGNYAPPLKYRNGQGSPTVGRPLRSAAFGTTRGNFKGVSSRQTRNVLPNNNLPTRIYKKLNGPRLAPRKEASRVITNLVALPVQVENDSIQITCAWFDVISAKDRPFLKYHFDGEGRNPKYDLRGIRPYGMMLIREITQLWIRSLITGKS
jgi:hypothetical protein